VITRVMLVRHGATVLAAEDRFAGSSDVPLSEMGVSQATRLGERLASTRIDAFYASNMHRAMHTAQLIAQPHRKPVEPQPALREIDHGRWEKLTRAEVEELYPEEYRIWEKDPFTFAPLQGESGLSVLARALPALQNLVARHEGETILVVSHKATLRLLLGSFLGFDLRGYRDHLDQSPCALNILDFKDPGRACLRLFNDVSHYEQQIGLKQASLSKWWDAAHPVAPDVMQKS
jgi:broad specificity phosphatase PhoE